MLLLLLLAGRLCVALTDVPQVAAPENSLATLPCPQRTGDVTWSRFRGGEPVVLVSIRNGVETRSDRRFGSLADNSLVITGVTRSDAAMYLCNKGRVYLEVTDPCGGGGGACRGAGATGEQALAWWRIGVGAGVAVAVTLSAIFTIRSCSRRRRRTNGGRAADEVIYEEIGDGGSSRTHPVATVGVATVGEPVYHLVQRPLQTGHVP